MNRGEIKTAIKDAMRLDPGLINNKEREKAVNEVLDELSALGVWMTSSSSTVSTTPVAIPATVAQVERAYWNGQRLKRADLEDMPKTIPDGEPVWWWTAVDPATGVLKIYTYPKINVSGTFLMEGIGKAATPIANDETGSGADATDLTSFGVPADWHTIIADGAIAKCHLKNGNYLAKREYEGSFSKQRDLKYVAGLEKLNQRRFQNEDDESPRLSADTFISPWG